MGYKIWAGKVQKYVDWCQIAAFLQTKKATEKISLETAYNIISHELYEHLYFEKWHALKEKRKVDADSLAETVLSKVAGVVERKWDETVNPALHNEFKHMTMGEYVNFVEEKFQKPPFREVCKKVANAVNQRRPGRYNYIAEFKDYDILTDKKLGIGARPDMFVSASRNIIVVDIKKKVTRGAQLQNTIGYLVALANKERLAKMLGLDPDAARIVQHTMFEAYSTGEEIEFFVSDSDINQAKEIANKIRHNEIPPKCNVCTPKKQASCGVSGACNNLYGSIEELLKR